MQNLAFSQRDSSSGYAHWLVQDLWPVQCPRQAYTSWQICTRLKMPKRVNAAEMLGWAHGVGLPASGRSRLPTGPASPVAPAFFASSLECCCFPLILATPWNVPRSSRVRRGVKTATRSALFIIRQTDSLATSHRSPIPACFTVEGTVHRRQVLAIRGKLVQLGPLYDSTFTRHEAKVA